MLRSSAPSRKLAVRCWSRCVMTEDYVTNRSKTTVMEIRRRYRHFAMGHNSMSRHLQHQQLSPQYQPTMGQSPSQFHKHKNSFGINKNNMNYQIRTVFIQTENTPNPESIKFLPSNTVRSVFINCQFGILTSIYFCSISQYSSTSIPFYVRHILLKIFFG